MQKGLTGEDAIACPAMEELLGVIARLRGEGGCPWDRKQTLESLRPFLVEESCELLDAIESCDPVAHRDEMGDVLLQVLLQARIREEEGQFDFDGVAGHLRDKLVRRHPHVFGDAEAVTPEDVVRNWNAIKVQERGEGARTKRLDDLPGVLPALMRAQRVQERAARQGFDWSCVEQVLDKVEEEIGEVREALSDGDGARIEDELGDLLFALVNVCRVRKLDAESVLRKATSKFVRRFHEMEALLQADSRTIPGCEPGDLDRVWEAVKREERSGEAG